MVWAKRPAVILQKRSKRIMMDPHFSPATTILCLRTLLIVLLLLDNQSAYTHVHANLFQRFVLQHVSTRQKRQHQFNQINVDRSNNISNNKDEKRILSLETLTESTENLPSAKCILEARASKLMTEIENDYYPADPTLTATVMQTHGGALPSTSSSSPLSRDQLRDNYNYYSTNPNKNQNTKDYKSKSIKEDFKYSNDYRNNQYYENKNDIEPLFPPSPSTATRASNDAAKNMPSSSVLNTDYTIQSNIQQQQQQNYERQPQFHTTDDNNLHDADNPQRQQKPQQTQPSKSTFKTLPSKQNLSSRALLPIIPSFAAASILLYFRPIGVDKQLTLLHLYALSLIASSIGFYRFLYFISHGYALGVALPVAVNLVHSNYLHWRLNNNNIFLSIFAKPTLATIHSVLVILWGIRLSSFLYWREHYSWPALHKRLQKTQAFSPPIHMQTVCWLLYSLVYTCLALPSWQKMRSLSASINKANGTKFTSVLAILLQLTGLSLETVADWQKCQFKQLPDRRQDWCRVGLWKYSTHPNYAGEWLFWAGTVLGGLVTVLQSNRSNIGTIKRLSTALLRATFMVLGLVFVTIVLKNAQTVSDKQHAVKYGSQEADSEYSRFVRNYGVFGPRFHTWKSLFWALLAKVLYRLGSIRSFGTNASTKNTATTLTVDEMKRLGMIPSDIVILQDLGDDDDVSVIEEFTLS